MSTIEIKKVLLKRGNTAQSEAYVGALGEVTIDTDLNCLRIHDGVTPGGEIVASTETTIQDTMQGVVDEAIAGLLNGAPEALDTLKELADALGNNSDSITDILTTLATKADLSYVNDVNTSLNAGLDLKANVADLAAVATTGSYNDLTDMPAAFDPTGLATETFVTDAIAAIPPTDLTGLATETYVNTAISGLQVYDQSLNTTDDVLFNGVSVGVGQWTTNQGLYSSVSESNGLGIDLLITAGYNDNDGVPGKIIIGTDSIAGGGTVSVTNPLDIMGAGTISADEDSNIQVSTANRINLEAGGVVNVYAGENQWQFDDAGVLTTAGDIVVNGGLELSAGIVTTATNSSLQAANGGLLSLSSTDSNTTSESAVRAYVDTADNANNRVYIYTDNQGTGDLGTWTFAPNGTLTLPGDTAFMDASANFVGIYADASQNNGIEVYTTNTEIFNTGNVNITANVAGTGKTWTFDNTGDFTAPGNVVVSQLKFLDNASARIRGDSDIIKATSNVGVELTRTGFAANTTSVAVDSASAYLSAYDADSGNENFVDCYSDRINITSSGNITLVTDNGSNEYTWTFNGTDGSITFPDSTTQTTAWTGTVSYNDLTDVPATVGGSMNYVQSQPAKVSSVSSGQTIASVTITTNGGPVQVVANGDANGLTAGAWVTYNLYRDSTAIGTVQQAESSATNENTPFSISAIDAPAAGTYTYSLQAVNVTGTVDFGENAGPTIYAIELQGPQGAQGPQGDPGPSSYNDLTDTPTTVSTFTNDAGYVAGTNVTNMVTLTQAEYDAITPDSATVYFIVG